MARYQEVAERNLLLAQAKMLEHRVKELADLVISHARNGLEEDDVVTFQQSGEAAVADIAAWIDVAADHFAKVLAYKEAAAAEKKAATKEAA